MILFPCVMLQYNTLKKIELVFFTPYFSFTPLNDLCICIEWLWLWAKFMLIRENKCIQWLSQWHDFFLLFYIGVFIIEALILRNKFMCVEWNSIGKIIMLLSWTEFKIIQKFIGWESDLLLLRLPRAYWQFKQSKHCVDVLSKILKRPKIPTNIPSSRK